MDDRESKRGKSHRLLYYGWLVHEKKISLPRVIFPTCMSSHFTWTLLGSSKHWRQLDARADEHLCLARSLR